MAWKIIFVVSLFAAALKSQVVPQTPCPWYFQYIYEGGTTKGHLRIPPPRDYAEILIELKMLVTTNLTTNYFGHMDLLEGKDNAVSRLQRGDFSLIPLRVIFPVKNPLPVLVSLKVNGREICSQNPGRVIGPYTFLKLLYTLKMSVTFFPTYSGVPQISPDPYAYFRPSAEFIMQPSTPAPHPLASSIFEWTFGPPTPLVQQTPRTTQPSTQPITTTSSTTEKDIQIHINPRFVGCGVQHKNDNAQQLGFGAFVIESIIQRSEWPWLVAIFRAPPIFNFACTGTLVSSKHVITAKSCLIERQFSPGKLLVYVGKFNLHRLDERYSYAQEVRDVYLHGGMTISPNEETVDLALITFKNPVNFDQYIRPICLHHDNDLSHLLDSLIVGWGATDFDAVKDAERLVPKKVKMILTRDMKKCQNYNPKIKNENALCAYQKSRSTGVCKEDRGGGLYGKDTQGTWFLQGVVSNSDWGNNNNCIDPDAVVLLTNAMTNSAKSWLHEIMAK